MKKVLMCILVTLCFIITGCVSDNKGEKMNILKDVTITIKKDTLNNTGATILIEDYSNQVNEYGIEYQIDKKVNDTWVWLDPITEEVTWTTRKYFVDDNKKLEFNYNWENLYGKLEKGDYRLVKYVHSIGSDKMYYIFVEFSI